jgi:hypothetical protein
MMEKKNNRKVKIPEKNPGESPACGINPIMG